VNRGIVVAAFTLTITLAPGCGADRKAPVPTSTLVGSTRPSGAAPSAAPSTLGEPAPASPASSDVVPDASLPPAAAPSTPVASAAPDGPYSWVGLTQAEVGAIVEARHPTHSLSGHPRLTVKGATWLIEYEPGGCNDWAIRLTVVFANGKVRSVDANPRGRWTGKYCM
jgi:hypothetical protein